MRKITLSVLFVAIYFGTGCGSGEETPAPEGDAGTAAAEPTDTRPPPPADTQPADVRPGGVVYIGGVPFGPAPADTSNCPCGIGCVKTLAPDGKGYYCEYVCMSCT